MGPLRRKRPVDSQNIYQRRVGDTVAVEFMRGQERKPTTVAVTEREAAPVEFADMADPADNLVPRLGVLVIPLDARISSMLPQVRRQGGLLVAAKSADAPPSEQGLAIGDVIDGLNGAAVTSLEEFKRAVARIPSGAPCVPQVQRGRRQMFVAVEIDSLGGSRPPPTGHWLGRGA